jgi:hypothetical protein
MDFGLTVDDRNAQPHLVRVRIETSHGQRRDEVEEMAARRRTHAQNETRGTFNKQSINRNIGGRIV